MVMARRHLELSDDKLIELWQSDKTTRLLARELDCQIKYLTDSWYRLKRSRKLPKKTRPPDADDPEAHWGNGAIDVYDQGEGRRSEVDELLQQLWTVHKNPRYDIPLSVRVAATGTDRIATQRGRRAMLAEQLRR